MIDLRLQVQGKIQVNYLFIRILYLYSRKSRTDTRSQSSTGRTLFLVLDIMQP